MSQILTTPSESLVIVMPSFACRAMLWIGAEATDIDFGSITVKSVNGVSIFQTLTDLSVDAVMREEGEENVREHKIIINATSDPCQFIILNFNRSI